MVYIPPTPPPPPPPPAPFTILAPIPQFHGIQVGDVKDARLAARKAKAAPRKKGGEARLLEVDDGRPDRGGGGGKSGCCCAIL